MSGWGRGPTGAVHELAGLDFPRGHWLLVAQSLHLSTPGSACLAANPRYRGEVVGIIYKAARSRHLAIHLSVLQDWLTECFRSLHVDAVVQNFEAKFRFQGSAQLALGSNAWDETLSRALQRGRA